MVKMQSQKDFTEKSLFDYYLVSSSEEKTINSQIPFYLDTNTFHKINEYSDKINKIAMNVLTSLYEKHSKLISYIDDFPLKEKIFGLNCDITNLLWTRFDTFRDDSCNILFSEFNYDKPCTQKELGLYGSIDFEGNVNKDFENKLVKAIHNLSKNKTDGKCRIAVLIDPCHYEELHVSLYLKSICDSSDIVVLPVGPTNLSVSENRVYAFGSEKVDIIIRLFPIEYLHEVSNIEAILDCFEKGYVSIVTDPRIIAIQAKVFFAYLWELADSNSTLLTEAEKATVRKCLPHTVIFSEDYRSEVLEHKDKYVIKASLGRYSEEVYIGRLYTEDSWKQKVDEVLCSKKLHILQDVIDIKKEYTFRPNNYEMHVPCLAYGNFGTFIIGDVPEGLCVRWSSSLLTGGDSEWMSPVGIKDYDFRLIEYSKPDRKALWDEVVEGAMFQYGFTGQYVNTTEYVSLNSLLLERKLYDEIMETCSEFCSILSKTSKLVESNLDMFLPLLGIPEPLKKIIQNPCTDSFCAIGRLDLVIDMDGNIKILEFNSETPAGLVESIGIQDIIRENLDIPYANPNKYLKNNITESFSKILKDFEAVKSIRNVAFLCTSYHEDLYNTNILYKALKETGSWNVLYGNIYDLEVRENKLYLYDTPLDAIYRYFPLDWFANEEELGDVINVINNETFSINPTNTIITQSKAIYAVIYELIGKGFFTEEEELFIKKYIPYTCLEPDNDLPADCLAKPCLSREGNGIVMSYEGIDMDMDNYIYQERVNAAPVEMIKYTTEGCSRKYQFPVIGVYVAGSKPSGIFSRVGDLITNDKASFLPTFVNSHK
jgi:Glutathionylspermidine synthase